MKKECCNINEVVQEFYDYLKGYIVKKTGDITVAEDIVQEVMVKLVESHKKEREINNVKAWLFQVTRHTIADYYKTHNLEYNFDEEWKEDAIKSQSLPKILATDFVIPMIELLPQKYSRPLMLSNIENVAQKEIADILNLGLSATKMRIQRGREKLQKLFVECCQIEYDKKGDFIGCTIKDNCSPLKSVEKELNESTES
ncbi:sigma-70 family RNA polymerase sigma factor [Aequorivita marina]|uniref:sigma-70 family RNA polymerase sigma factor n=1 Tax=Aequorivita marina TaxID=3073654 RepID=UPI002873FF26|nr:sigma-70 family RNA polymerase sigma factor [Aequorivita sp. S2608]MDS1299417.1 sigma-70 family RNA polymerase sigma factor [Aequorivita sp. S2608]